MKSNPNLSPTRKILGDPLAHFFTIGAVLFLVVSLAKPAQEEQIIADREALLSFIQYRSKAFEAQAAAAILDKMSADERQRLADNYIREEALFREAQSLGLAEGDYVIRQRMIQKLEFITDAVAAPPTPTDEAIAAFYEQNKQNYFQEPSATFAHVFVKSGKISPGAAMGRAQQILETLRAENAGLKDATRYGDRFLFHTNYVERTYDYIEDHFGDEATKVIFSDRTPLSTWSGPVLSEYGAHLLYVTSRSSGRFPPIDEIKTILTEDMARAARREQTNELTDAIVAKYAPVIETSHAPLSQTMKLNQ